MVPPIVPNAMMWLDSSRSHHFGFLRLLVFRALFWGVVGLALLFSSLAVGASPLFRLRPPWEPTLSGCWSSGVDCLSFIGNCVIVSRKGLTSYSFCNTVSAWQTYSAQTSKSR